MKEPQWSWILNLHSSLQQEARFEFSAGLLGISFGGFETLVLSLVCRVLGVCGRLWASGVRCLQLDPGVCGVPKTLNSCCLDCWWDFEALAKEGSGFDTHGNGMAAEATSRAGNCSRLSLSLSLSLYVYNTI